MSENQGCYTTVDDDLSNESGSPELGENPTFGSKTAAVEAKLKLN